MTLRKTTRGHLNPTLNYYRTSTMSCETDISTMRMFFLMNVLIFSPRVCRISTLPVLRIRLYCIHHHTNYNLKCIPKIGSDFCACLLFPVPGLRCFTRSESLGRICWIRQVMSPPKDTTSHLLRWRNTHAWTPFVPLWKKDIRKEVEITFLQLTMIKYILSVLLWLRAK